MTEAADGIAPETVYTPGFSIAEEYLRAHHDRSPGRQSEGGRLARRGDGRTSYDAAADLAAGAARVLDLGCADAGLLDLLAGRGVRALAASNCADRRQADAQP
ncbi:MAG: hypothetical protein ACRDVE_11870 [Actinocrinis sp.]